MEKKLNYFSQYFSIFFLYKPNYYNSKFPKSELLLNIKFIKIMFVCYPHHNKSKNSQSPNNFWFKVIFPAKQLS